MRISSRIGHFREGSSAAGVVHCGRDCAPTVQWTGMPSKSVDIGRIARLYGSTIIMIGFSHTMSSSHCCHSSQTIWRVQPLRCTPIASHKALLLTGRSLRQNAHDSTDCPVPTSYSRRSPRLSVYCTFQILGPTWLAVGEVAPGQLVPG